MSPRSWFQNARESMREKKKRKRTKNDTYRLFLKLFELFDSQEPGVTQTHNLVGSSGSPRFRATLSSLLGHCEMDCISEQPRRCKILSLNSYRSRRTNVASSSSPSPGSSVLISSMIFHSSSWKKLAASSLDLEPCSSLHGI